MIRELPRIDIPFMTVTRHLLAPALGVVALAGCGGSKDTATTPPAATQAAATPAATKPAGAKSVAVSIKDFEYGPKTVTVVKGGTVRFKNVDPANHTVTFDTGAMKSLGNQRTGVERSMRFAKAGTFAYHCDFHPNMHGTVVVR